MFVAMLVVRLYRYTLRSTRFALAGKRKSDYKYNNIARCAVACRVQELSLLFAICGEAEEYCVFPHLNWDSRRAGTNGKRSMNSVTHLSQYSDGMILVHKDELQEAPGVRDDVCGDKSKHSRSGVSGFRSISFSSMRVIHLACVSCIRSRPM